MVVDGASGPNLQTAQLQLLRRVIRPWYDGTKKNENAYQSAQLQLDSLQAWLIGEVCWRNDQTRRFYGVVDKLTNSMFNKFVASVLSFEWSFQVLRWTSRK